MIIKRLSSDIQQYLMVTANYWVFTLTDGALRMLIVLHFHLLGYGPLDIALLFLFYEFFGIVTNVFGGWLAVRFGLNRTMNVGLGIQIVALGLLLAPASMLSVVWVMVAQALSGIAKDLNKMSAKSAIKLLASDDNQSSLYQWVAFLTGSKNALKGVGFFIGGGLLAWLGFTSAILVLFIALLFMWITSMFCLRNDLGRAVNKPKFKQIFSKKTEINTLSAARFLLFGARDVWFVVALPLFLISALGWSSSFVGAFLAVWVIAYGVVQSLAPLITGRGKNRTPNGQSVVCWAFLLALVTAVISVSVYQNLNPLYSLLPGLLVFGAVFAINSSIHSYLIVRYADSDQVAIDVGFYYMANAAGRLIGTVLSGLLFQRYGLGACLFVSTLFIVLSGLIALKLPKGVDKHSIIST